ERVGRLYGADLLGGGVGCLLVLPLMDWIGGDQGIFAIGLLAATGAVLLAHAHGEALARAAAVAVAALFAVGPSCNRDRTLVGVTSPRTGMGGAEGWVREDRELTRTWNALSRLGFSETVANGSIYVRIDSSCQTSVPSAAPERIAQYLATRDFERIPFVLDRH